MFAFEEVCARQMGDDDRRDADDAPRVELLHGLHDCEIVHHLRVLSVSSWMRGRGGGKSVNVARISKN